jgi:hypothetical protein
VLTKEAVEKQTSQARVQETQNAATRLQAELPGGALEKPENKYIRLQSQKAAGQDLAPADQAFLKGYEKDAALKPAITIGLQNQAGGAPLKDAALDNAAENYWSKGVLPPGGRGPQVMAQNRAIMNRAAELHPGESIVEGSASYKANAGSLAKLQTQFDAVDSFEKTALKNLDQVAITGAKVPDLGVRFANVPVRNISSQMIGTPEMAQFRTALLTAQTEAAKVLNSATGAGVLSDSARKEAQDILDGNLSYPAMISSINQLKTDMGNRHQSYAEQIADIQGRLKGKNSAPAAGGGTAAPATSSGWGAQFGGVQRNQ